MSNTAIRRPPMPFLLLVEDALGQTGGNFLIVTDAALAAAWPTMSLAKRKAAMVKHDARAFPAIKYPPAVTRRKRALAKALITADTDAAADAAALAVSRYFDICLECVSDVLSLYTDNLRPGASLRSAVDAFLDEVDQRQDDPLHEDEYRCNAAGRLSA